MGPKLHIASICKRVFFLISNLMLFPLMNFCCIGEDGSVTVCRT